MHPILFQLGPATIHSWGVLVAVAIILVVSLIYKNSAREGFQAEKIIDGTFWTILSGLIGARLIYVIFHWPLFQKNPLEALYLWQGGLAWYGALGGGFSTAWFYCWKNKINFLKIMDLVAPFVALGYAVGRIGCFLNGCCYGKICRLPWAVKFPNYPGLRHPTQIYSALFWLFLFLVLLFLKKYKKFDGQIFYLGIIIYSFYRFFLEVVREDVPYFFYGLNSIQIASVVIFVVFGGIYVYQKLKLK